MQYYKWYIIDHVVANKYFQICWWCAKSNKIIFYKFLASFQAPSTCVIGEIKDVSWSHDVTSVIFWPRVESESWNMHHNINLKKDKTSHYPHFVLSFSDLLNLYTSSKFSQISTAFLPQYMRESQFLKISYSVNKFTCLQSKFWKLFTNLFTYRSSRLKIYFKIGVLKKFENFTKTPLLGSLFNKIATLLKRDS